MIDKFNNHDNIRTKTAKELFISLILLSPEVTASPLFYGCYIDMMFDESPQAAYAHVLRQYKRGRITFKEYDFLRKIINTGCDNGYFECEIIPSDTVGGITLSKR